MNGLPAGSLWVSAQHFWASFRFWRLKRGKATAFHLDAVHAVVADDENAEGRQAELGGGLRLAASLDSSAWRLLMMEA
jgi:hypothetical protein